MKPVTRHLRKEKRGISTVIVVMLSLALLVTVVGNMVIWSYQMNELDMKRIQENITLKNAAKTDGGLALVVKNNGPEGVQIVGLWIIDSEKHERYTLDLFVNSGETASLTLADIKLPESYTLVRIVTEKGNTAVFSPT